MDTLIQLQNDSSRLVLDLQGGYVHRWTISNTDILYVGADPKRRGIPLLFPYFGKPDEMLPQHGFARDTRWHLAASSEHQASLVFSHNDISDKARAYYPYAFEVRIDLILAATTLTYALHIANAGLKDMPISPGIHPYWAVPHAQKKHIQIKGITGFDAASINWDTSPPDADFPFLANVSLSLPQHVISLEDITTDKPHTDQITVWSQSLANPDHDFVCVEPICGVRRGYVTKPILVAPAQSWSVSWKFGVTSA